MSVTNTSTYYSINSICNENPVRTKYGDFDICPSSKAFPLDLKNGKISQDLENVFLQSDNNPADHVPTVSTEDSFTSSPSYPLLEDNKNETYIECVVCGDKSSGKHYGQITCEGCKSFFKRSVRRDLTYSCRGDQKCPVDVHRRNQCQDCRFQKCLKMGMRKEGNTILIPHHFMNCHSQAVQQGRISQFNSHFHPYMSFKEGSLYFNRFTGLALPNNSALSKSDKSHLMSYLFRSKSNSYLDEKYFRLDGVYVIASRILKDVIHWSRTIPFFSNFSIADQLSLLKSSWSELFILSSAQSSTPLHFESLLTSAGLKINPTESEKLVLFLDHIKLFHDQIEKLKKHQIDSAEYSCLKALVLFNSDIQGLSDPVFVENIQDIVQNALEKYEKCHYPNQVIRFGKLLLRISQLKSVNSTIIEELFFNSLSGKDLVTNLIKEYIIHKYPCNSIKGSSEESKRMIFLDSNFQPKLSTMTSDRRSLNPDSLWLFKSPGKFPNSIQDINKLVLQK